MPDVFGVIGRRFYQRSGPVPKYSSEATLITAKMFKVNPM